MDGKFRAFIEGHGEVPDLLDPNWTCEIFTSEGCLDEECVSPQFWGGVDRNYWMSLSDYRGRRWENPVFPIEG